MKGKNLLDALPEIIDQPFVKILGQVYNSGIPYSQKAAKAEIIVDGVPGTYYFDITYTPLRDALGNVYGILDMAIDVTDAVIAQQKNHENEQFARTVFYNSPVAKLVYTGENMILREANEKMIEIFGRGESIIGKPVMESVPELRETSMYERYRHVLHTGETQNQYGERILLFRQGKPYWGYYDYTFKALRNGDGIIYGVVCTFIEVTDKIIAHQKLEESESLLRGAIELADLGTWSIDVDTNALTYSKRLIEWFGFDPGEQDYNKVIPILDEQDRERVAKAVAWALNPESDGIYDEVYTVIHPETGEKRILHAQGKAQKNEQGKIFRMNGTARDITIQRALQISLEREVEVRTEELASSNEELRATNEELATSNKQLSLSNDQLAQYAYVASHDLQEPLRKIQTFSSIIATHAGVSDVTKEYIEKISRSANRMALLINDLLAFSRLMESGSAFTLVNLNETVAAVINDFELIITERRAIISISALPVIEAVGLQMNQLFYNLIGNALKFVEANTVPKIDIDCKKLPEKEVRQFIPVPSPAAQYYHISIRDNGIGFEMQYAEHIFEVFKRLHTRDIFPGSGIGLSLCRRIVLNHHGALYAESKPGNGSTFHIIVPDRT